MRVGFQITKFNYHNIHHHMAEMAQMVDEGGFYSLWVMDHYFQMEMIGGPDQEMLEAYTTLGYLAGLTKNVTLGALVTGVVYREPGFLVKQVGALDVLSNGRAYLGIGAAWYEREALGLGFPFPPLKERFEQLEETLQIVHQMWRGDRTPYQGKHYTLAEPINNPMPISQPHPRIMIGGGGEKKTLRLVAQYADTTNLFAFLGVDGIKAKLDILRGHCDDVGRDYDTIEKSILTTADFSNGAEGVIQFCRDFAAIGIEHTIFNLPDYTDLGQIETFVKEIIPAVAEL